MKQAAPAKAVPAATDFDLTRALGESLEYGPCPACDSTEVHPLFWATDRLYRTTDKTFLVVECRRCRLMRLYPAPSPDELRQYYPDTYWFAPGVGLASRLEEAYRRFVLRDHVAFVRGAVKEAPPGLLLDVGCGGGLFLRLMRRHARRVAGLDFSANAAWIAWRRNGVPVACGSLSAPPLPPESCSVITMFHVLEHLHEPGACVQAAHRLLRAGGRLVVQVPNAACWQFLMLGENWNGIDVPRHLIHFRPADLEGLLGSCGFQVTRQKFFSLRDNPAGLASSLVPALDPMARQVRRLRESGAVRLLKDSVYLCLVLASLPFALLEAACRAGSTMMMEAVKR